MKKHLSFVFAVLPMAAVVILCAAVVICGFNSRQKEKENFKELSEITASTTVSEQESTQEQKEQENTETRAAAGDVNYQTSNIEGGSYEVSYTEHSIADLISMNSDCFGWLSIPNTDFSYPVMHTPSDSQKYLNLDFYGNYSGCGTPFLDYRCSKNSDNLIIYGHHMNDGSVFGELVNYTSRDYFKNHSQIVLETSDGTAIYDVFSVMTVDSDDYWYGFVNAEIAKKYDMKIKYAKENSQYDTGVTPSYGQQILSLSTCYGFSSKGRILVLAAKTCK